MSVKKTINRKNISEQIFDILKEQIISGEYKDGDRLPGENELAQMYGVSRMTARNVFQKLISLGIAEAKNGEGTFVKKTDFEKYLSETLEFINNTESTEDISEFRNYFEPMCIEIACKKRTEDDIAQLEKLYANLLSSAESDNINDFFEADYKFHLFICEISKNAIIKIIYEILMKIISKQYEESMRKYAVINNYSFNKSDENYAIRKSAQLHREIVDDIISGNNEISRNRWKNLNKVYDTTPLPDKKWNNRN